MGSRALFSIVVTIAIFSTVRTAAAEPAEVEELIREVLELRKARKEAAAFLLLQKAHAIGSTPRTAAQLGLVEINLGYWLEAERHLSSSLAARLDPWVHQHRTTLEENLARARAAIGEIVLTGTPPGAQVSVNKTRAGHLPLTGPLRAGEGPATLEMSAPGYETGKVSVTVFGGERTEVVLHLKPDPHPPVVMVRPGDRQTLSRDTGANFWIRPAAWVAAGAAAGALALGVHQTTQWRTKKDDFDRHVADASGLRDCGVDDTNRGGPGCAAIYSDLDRAKKVAVGGYVAAGVLAAGSLTMFVLSPDRTDRSYSTLCLPSIAAVGASCRLTF